MTLRDPNLDLLKEGTALRNARKTRCSIEGCENFLTAYQGPGSDTLCRNHQKNLADYGGLATTKKSYSQNLNRLCRTLLTVDHIDGNHENNNDENLQTLCTVCHAIKTVINGDTLTPSNQN